MSVNSRAKGARISGAIQIQMESISNTVCFKPFAIVPVGAPPFISSLLKGRTAG